MSVRLGFSVAIQVDADVLLVDEVLAVGDAAFQQKCFDEFDRHEATRAGRSLFVTHDMGSVERFCDRGDAARAGPDASSSASPRTISRAYSRAQLRAHRHGDGQRPSRAGRAIADRLVRGRRRRADRDRRAGRSGCVACIEVEFARGGRGPGVRDHLPQRRAPHDLRGHDREPRRPDTGRFGPASRMRRALCVRELARAEPLHADAVDRPTRRPRTTTPRPRARTWPRCWWPRPRCTGGVVDLPVDARGRAPVSASAAARYRGPSALGDDLRRFVEPDLDARRRPTSSCASSARCSATSGR